MKSKEHEISRGADRNVPSTAFGNSILATVFIAESASLVAVAEMVDRVLADAPLITTAATSTLISTYETIGAVNGKGRCEVLRQGHRINHNGSEPHSGAHAQR